MNRRVLTLVGLSCVVLTAMLAVFLIFRPGPSAGDVQRISTETSVEGTTSTSNSGLTANEPEDRVRSQAGADRIESQGFEQEGLFDSQVRVVDHLDTTAGIPRARIEIPGRRVLAWTDALGLASLPRPSTGVLRESVVIAAEGYATREVEVHHEESLAVQVIEMSAEGVIAGHVTTSFGPSMGDAQTVLCWRSGRWFSGSAIVDALSGRASFDVHVVNTSPADGSFRIGGLDKEHSYMLAAFGRGYWLQDSVGPVRTGTHDVECRVSTLFGLVVRVEDLDGQPIRTSPHLLLAGPGWVGRVQGAESLQLMAPERAILAHQYGAASMEGISLDHDAGNWATSLVLFTRKDGSKESIPGVVFQVEPPGFEPVDAILDLPWLGHDLGDLRLATRRVQSCQGDLAIGFAPGALAGWNAPCELVLKDLSSERVFRCSIDLCDPESLTVSGIPCGTYEVRLSAVHTFFSWPTRGSPATVVSITGETPASVDLGLGRSVGQIEVELIDEKGESYRDTVKLEILAERQGQWLSRNPIWIDRAPYRCAWLPAADWALRVEFETASFHALEELTRFTVLAGRTTKVVVPIARR